MIGVDEKSQKALISLYFCAVLSYGRKEASVNFGFVFANLCKLFTQKRSVLHFGTDHLRKLRFLRFFALGVFFDYSDAKFECWIVKAMDITAHRFYCIDLTILIFWLIDTLDCSNFRVILQAHLLLSLNFLPLRSF